MTTSVLFAILLAVPVQTGTIQGNVVREGTSEPVAGVKITVGGGATMTPRQAQMILSAEAIGMNMSSADTAIARAVISQQALGETPASATAMTAVTDDAGHFVIQNVPAGMISVRAQLTGYYGPSVNGIFPDNTDTSIPVKADESSKVGISLVPAGTISGKVFDSNGKPYFNAIVAVLRPVYTRGSISLEGVEGKTADDLGGFRFYPLPPGEYYVSVMTRAPGARATAQPGSEVQITTLYPNATILEAASKVVVVAGEETRNIDVHVKAARTSTISGRVTTTFPPVTGRTGRGGNVIPPTAVLSLASREIDGFSDLQGGVTVTTDTEGKFQLPGVLPGVYDLYARMLSPTGWGGQGPPERATNPMAFGRAIVEVRGNDIDNLQIVVHQGVDVRGRVTVDGIARASKVFLNLVPDDTLDRVGDSPTGSVYGQVAMYRPTIAADGTFTIPVVPEGHYRLAVQVHEPADSYVADIRMNGASVYDNGLQVGAGELNPLEVDIRSNGGSIDATVLDAEQNPVAGKTVVLIPSQRRQNPVLYRVGQSDAQGHARWTGVAPGQYRLFAWNSVQGGAWMNAEFIGKIEEFGKPVTVSAGTRQGAEIRVLP